MTIVKPISIESPPDTAVLRKRVHQLGLHGLLARWDELALEPWVLRLVTLEEDERCRRSLERRLKKACIGNFKPIADFDWGWPRRVDREAIEDVVSLRTIDEGLNSVFLGPNGVGKTMILRNAAHQAALRGYTIRFCTASDMLADLAAQESSAALSRRLRRYCQPRVLCIDEVGYLSYSNRYADLLFEVVTRRYNEHRPILLSTNKPFAEWSQVFPSAACVVTLIDRLVHRAEIIEIDADSYRLKEAQERAAAKAAKRRSPRRSAGG